MFSSRYFIDIVNDSATHVLHPSTLNKRDYGGSKDKLYLHKRRLYDDPDKRRLQEDPDRRRQRGDWILQVRYYPMLSSFMACSPDPDFSLVIGDIERKGLQRIQVAKGIRCFDYCPRASFIVTGGRDKIMYGIERRRCLTGVAVCGTSTISANLPTV